MSTDYFPPIQRAVQGLLPNTQETRTALYEKARAALLRQLNAADPALTPGQIARERSLLEEAIRRVEHHYDEAELMPEPMASERPAAPKAAPAANSDEPATETMLAEQSAEEATPAPESLPAFAERRAEKRRPQAPRRATRTGGLQRYALMGLVGLLIVGGGVASVLYLRGHDSKTVLVSPQTAPATQTAAKPDADPAKLDDRLGAASQAPASNQVASAPAAPSPATETPKEAPEPADAPGQSPAPLLPPSPTQAPEGQRATLREEDPTAPMKGRTFEGTINWRTESQASGTNGPLETVVVGELNFPDRKMKSLLTLRRNSDPAFPASFVLQLQMTVPADYPNGNVNIIKGVLTKAQPQIAGVPLDGGLMKVTTGVFLMGLLDPPDEKGRNARALKDNEWFDIAYAYDNGRNAMITFEKGPAGDKVFNDAIASWNSSTAAAR